MATRYPIPAGPYTVELAVKRSRFIASINVAPSVPEAKACVQSIREDFPDATHHVYAFRIGYAGSIIEGMSDDGEPSGTAGRPCLSVLRGCDLGDVVLIVTRYFGGIKLGKGGLVRAYTQATQAALEGVTTVLKTELRAGVLTVTYAAYEPIRKLLTNHTATIVDESFESDVTFRISCAADQTTALDGVLREISAGRYIIAWD